MSQMLLIIVTYNLYQEFFELNTINMIKIQCLKYQNFLNCSKIYFQICSYSKDISTYYSCGF